MNIRFSDWRIIALILLLFCAAIYFRRFNTQAARATAQPLQLAIHDIQGNGATSPHTGRMVTTTGIVTALKTNGFFLQAPDAQRDADPNTSEGIFIFTSSAAQVTHGQAVSVTGTVTEFRSSAAPNSLPLTELTGPTITVNAAGQTLPAPITLTAADLNPAGPLAQLEKYEGMRVRGVSLVTVSPTQGALNEANAESTSNGVFFAVLQGVARPFREAGLEALHPAPAGAPCCVPRFDGNPERLRLDTRSSQLFNRPSGPLLDLTTGAGLSSATGPLDYTASNYTILVDPPAITTPGLAFSNAQTILNAVPVPAPEASEFTIASFNLQRFFDTADDPGKSDVVLTQQAFDNRLNKASLAIRNVLRAPDIIGVEEAENLAALQAIAAKVNNDAVAAGAANPNYQAHLVEGNDPGGIDVGFLVKTARVNVAEVTQFGKDATYIDPTNNRPATLNDRPPLLLHATIQQPAGGTFAITVIVNHLRSLLNLDDPATGPRVRAKRRAQAEFLANLIQARQAADPNERLVSVGDYNAFQFNDGYVDLIGALKGTPAPAALVTLASSDLVNPDLINLLDFAPPAERYSYSFDGHAQTIDHVLATANLFPHATRLHFARNNADFPEIYRNSAARPERLSDHDAPVVYFSFTPAPAQAATVSAASFLGQELASESIAAVFGQAFTTVTETANTLPLPTTLGGATVKLKDSAGVERTAPLFFVSPTQINFLLPPGNATGRATISVTRSDGANASGAALITAAAPGLFAANAAGQGVAVAVALRVRADGSQSFEPVAQFDAALNRFVPIPIDLGAESEQVFVLLFGTGWQARSQLAAVSATLGGVATPVLYAGAQGGFTGLDQLNLRVPRSLAGRGEIDVLLTVEGKTANTVKLAIK